MLATIATVENALVKDAGNALTLRLRLSLKVTRNGG
jgi:hypothetical protein